MELIPSKKETSDDMDDSFDEADAALVLTSISCSPPTGLSILKGELPFRGCYTPPLSCSLPSNTSSPSNQLITLKHELKPVKHFQCLWKQPKCNFTTTSQEEIAHHVRTVHLSKGRLLRDRRSNIEAGDAMQVDGADGNNINEEDFYYTEVEPDAMESVVHSFRHLQTASPCDVTVSASTPPTKTNVVGKSAFSIIPHHQHSPDSAYGSVPVGQASPDHDYQKKGPTQIQTPAVPLPGIQQQDLSTALFSHSLPPSRLPFLSMGVGLGVEAPILEQPKTNRGVPDMANASSLGAAFLSVLQHFGQSPSDKDTNTADFSTSLPSSWLFPTKSLLPSAMPAQPQFPASSSGGGGVPFHIIAAAAAANNNAASSSDPNIANSICLSSSPPSTSSPSPPPHGMAGSLPSQSTLKHHRRIRSDVKKCRKVYGVEKRDMWCTQCRWKKACTRFME